MFDWWFLEDVSYLKDAINGGGVTDSEEHGYNDKDDVIKFSEEEMEGGVSD